MIQNIFGFKFKKRLKNYKIPSKAILTLTIADESCEMYGWIVIQFTSIIEFKINQKFVPWFQNFVFIGRFENVGERKFPKSSEYGKIILNFLHRDRPSAWAWVMGGTKKIRTDLDNVRTAQNYQFFLSEILRNLGIKYLFLRDSV